MTTRTRKMSLMAATGLSIAMLSLPAFAQEAASTTEATAAEKTTTTKAEAESPEVVIVRGVRGSLKSAVDRKRKSKQIVDSVDAEDVGKLPDNNVVEALAHVTGVQIDRVHGEGSSVSIRGMTDIATTVNGNSTATGSDRSMSLSDIPAELLKSVQVYKTRTADQVEGGIAGTVNVELRRPLDLKKGLTVAGSFRNVYSSIGDTSSPYASLLVADRFDTPIGEMGFLLNAAYTRNNYDENFVESESPQAFFCCTTTDADGNTVGTANTNLGSLPESQWSIITPYAVNYGVEKGVISRPSLNAAWQWRVNDNLDFVVEGSYFGSDEVAQVDRLHLTIQDSTSAVSNVVLASDGKTVESLTLTPTGTYLAGGPESHYTETQGDNYTTNAEMHWHKDRLTINSSIQYNWSRSSYYSMATFYRLDGVTSVDVDFNSDKVPGGGAYMTFNGVDLTDPSVYKLYYYHDESGISKSRELNGQSDLTYRMSDDKFLRSFQAGVRYSSRHTGYSYGYRDGAPNNWSGTLTDLSDFPYGDNLVSTTPDVDGFAPTWLHVSGADLMANGAAIRAWLVANNASGGADYWATDLPSGDQGQSFKSEEYTAALYGQFNYAFDWHFPVDGTFGVRAVNTWGGSSSGSYSYDKDWNAVIQTASAKGNYTDYLPSADAIIHFSPKLQLHLAYHYNVQRPNFYDMRPFAITYDTSNSLYVYAGNPDLKPNREDSYDASLEYYFGRGGTVSLAAYVKKPDGFIYYSCLTQDYAPTGDTRIVCTNRNAGPGTFQGYEFNAQGFFEFLPGQWRNLGASFNYTYLQVGKILYPYDDPSYTSIPGVYDAVGMSKYTYNAAIFYDTPQFSARMSYNFRDKYKTAVWAADPSYSPYVLATSSLDAAINWTPKAFVTFSLEATNLEKNNTVTKWGDPALLDYGVRVRARTIQLSARFRY